LNQNSELLGCEKTERKRRFSKAVDLRQKEWLIFQQEFHERNPGEKRKTYANALPGAGCVVM